MEPEVASSALVLVDKKMTRASRNKWFDVGDIVAVKHPTDVNHPVLIRRIRATSGTIVCILKDICSFTMVTLVDDPKDPQLVKVPKGHVFIESDNTQNVDVDSKTLGPVPINLVCGKVFLSVSNR
jgi:hypothetical protein